MWVICLLLPSYSADEGYSLTVAKAASCDRDPQAKFSRMLARVMGWVSLRTDLIMPRGRYSV